jgi:nucleoside-diphosphate-sugar epimerase
LAADLTSGEPPELPSDVDFAVYCVGAKASTEEAYRAAYVDGLTSFLRALDAASQAPSRVLFTSSTSVYAQSRGEWVDEDSPAEPTRFAGRILLEAEALLRRRGAAATVVRFGGIYGPGRTRLLERIARGEGGLPTRAGGGGPTAAVAEGAPQYTSRIHRDDAAGILHFLMFGRPIGQAIESLYLGVDCEPASEAEVFGFLAKALGVPAPVLARSSARTPERPGSKRCSNARLLAAGYRFLYPSFRDGYLPLVAAHLASASRSSLEPSDTVRESER